MGKNLHFADGVPPVEEEPAGRNSVVDIGGWGRCL